MIKIGLTILGALIGIELHRFAPTTLPMSMAMW